MELKTKKFQRWQELSKKNEINKGVKAWGSFPDGPVRSSFIIHLSDSDNIRSTSSCKNVGTTDGLVRVVGAVFDAVTFGVQLVDAHLVLALVGEIGAGARGCSQKRLGENHFWKGENRPAYS